jgi:hypothetical protein
MLKFYVCPTLRDTGVWTVFQSPLLKSGNLEIWNVIGFSIVNIPFWIEIYFTDIAKCVLLLKGLSIALHSHV